MDQTNQTNGAIKKKPVLFSIGSYSERNTRVINKIPKTNLFHTSNEVTPPPPLKDPSRGINYSRARPTSLNSAVSLDYNTQFNSEQLSFSQTLPNGALKKPQYSLDNEDCSAKSTVEKPYHPPNMLERSQSLEPEYFGQSGKVALRVKAYEGEPKTPTRLEFLPNNFKNRTLSRTSSQASNNGDLSSVCSPKSPTSVDETDTNDLSFRLQNELVKTLERSNLREMNDKGEEKMTTNDQHISSNTIEQTSPSESESTSGAETTSHMPISPTEEEINAIKSLDSMIQEAALSPEIDYENDNKDVCTNENKKEEITVKSNSEGFGQELMEPVIESGPLNKIETKSKTMLEEEEEITEILPQNADVAQCEKPPKVEKSSFNQEVKGTMGVEEGKAEKVDSELKNQISSPAVVNLDEVENLDSKNETEVLSESKADKCEAITINHTEDITEEKSWNHEEEKTTLTLKTVEAIVEPVPKEKTIEAIVEPIPKDKKFENDIKLSPIENSVESEIDLKTKNINTQINSEDEIISISVNQCSDNTELNDSKKVTMAKIKSSSEENDKEETVISSKSKSNITKVILNVDDNFSKNDNGVIIDGNEKKWDGRNHEDNENNKNI